MTQYDSQLRDLIVTHVPADGSSIGNGKLLKTLASVAGFAFDEQDYRRVRDMLLAEGLLGKGQGRGGSVYLMNGESDSFGLQAQTLEEEPEGASQAKAAAKPAKPVVTRAKPGEETQVISYRHLDKRKNNPEVGMVTPATDPDAGKTKWAYDPHLDPTLGFDPQRARIEHLIDDALESGDTEQMRQALEELKRTQSPYLNWAGKAERTSFEVDTVSLHVHERIDPASILSAVRKLMKKEGKGKGAEKAFQPGLFDAPFENLPLRDAIDFYRHERGWANRLIAGDSLLVMNSLLQKESMAGRVQMFYFDPPYGIKYGSNFQPFVGKRDVKDRNDADLTQEPEMIKAFRDTWELGIHSYLTYLRDRLLLARELLHESGSVFVQISDENLHHVREIMDEVFGANNFAGLITFKKTTSSTSNLLAGVSDYLVWYAKSIDALKYRQMYLTKEVGGDGGSAYGKLELPSGERRGLSLKERESGKFEGKVFRFDNLTSQSPGTRYDVMLDGKSYYPKGYWKTESSLMPRLVRSRRVAASKDNLYYVRFIEDFPAYPINNNWEDTSIAGFASDKRYVVETSVKVVERCMLMTTDPGDLVLDPTCGSGTTAFVAERWGRRWITCDTSRVAITLAKQRLMTSSFDYFELKYPAEGLKGGFIYKTVPHVTLKSIANNPDIDSIYERLCPTIGDALNHLNNLLKDAAEEFYIPRFTVTEGGRKGEKLDFQAGNRLLEWEVPYELPEEWLPESVRYWSKHAQPGQEREPTGVELAFEAFHKVRQAMQLQMDMSIASHADQEVLYDQPAVAKNKLRITGPFTVEAVPFPSVKSLDEASGPDEADASIARTGESGRQHQWLAELLKTGIRGKGGQILKFTDLEPLPFDKDMQSLHASGHLDSGERVVVSFGPEHAALEQRQVANALNEAGNLFPLPKMVVFCAFTFDPEAAKDIDAIKGITALKAQMNTDLLTEDLKKARSSNQSFWLMGQPDVEVRQLKNGRYEVEVHGFDYFDTAKGELVSGGKSKIAMWSLDTDYDERSLFPHQVFFPMAGKGEGWEKLKKNIRAELDETRLNKFHGTISLPFEAGDNRKIAVKIVDDRGIESLKVVALN
ncbi:site-specific DNA-methyltransferase [Pseudomonas aeruginosa]|uniref:site-specific DNA-methyltransferase n=1 Tax=Pseudomonas aeruginosa TaxID=287 RepID=UPI00200E52EE|nr:site-specific DNA-methyltransferase [Pseudomonas aeruginosa]MCL0278171.1 site-specific DNA-methyltransferase [Pseudomonas aeruginosa]MDI9283339.1 site-specific DNA-methyltransferase [Pseudomonas aeruginosa]